MGPVLRRIDTRSHFGVPLDQIRMPRIRKFFSEAPKSGHSRSAQKNCLPNQMTVAMQ
jgi:hypothetical protein